MSSRVSGDELVLNPPNILCWRGRRFACAIGWGGVRTNKREGDGATPAGRFPLRRVLYRPDRLAPPRTALPIAPLSPRDGWCDDPAHPLYNRPLRLPHEARHEELWRADRVYDVIVILGHNDAPVVPDLGERGVPPRRPAGLRAHRRLRRCGGRRSADDSGRRGQTHVSSRATRRSASRSLQKAVPGFRRHRIPVGCQAIRKGGGRIP